MKKLHILAILAAILLASCSHNASILGVGTAFRLGSGEVSLNYADGLFLNSVSRDNVRFTAELDSTVGVSYDPATNTYKGIKGISYEVGPQLGGYSKELGEANPDALKAYYDACSAYYEYRKLQESLPAQQKSAISDEKSKDATSSISDVIKTVLRRAGNGAETVSEPFTCSGNCELTGLASNDTIAYQTAVAAKLLSYADDTTRFDGENTTLKHSLESFLSRMEQLTAKGKSTTRMRIKAATVKDSRLIYIRYIMTEPDGNEFETNCPECVLLED